MHQESLYYVHVQSLLGVIQSIEQILIYHPCIWQGGPSCHLNCGVDNHKWIQELHQKFDHNSLVRWHLKLFENGLWLSPYIDRLSEIRCMLEHIEGSAPSIRLTQEPKLDRKPLMTMCLLVANRQNVAWQQVLNRWIKTGIMLYKDRSSQSVQSVGPMISGN